MRGYLFTSTTYKGIFLLILILIAMEYLFGSVTESTNFVFKSTKPQKKEVNQHIQDDHERRIKIKTNGNSTEYLSLIKNSTALNSNNSYNFANNAKNVSSLSSLFDIVSSVETTVNDTKIHNFTDLPFCPEDPPDLVGPVPVLRSPVPSIIHLESRFSWLKPGGHYSPDFCRVLKKVAIVIPFRCRGEHLLLFLQHMHPFLKKQQLDYTIFIIEQDNAGPFNRALLMNVGYMEALKRRKYDCFIFHDIDLLPENDKNLYTCPVQPRHMSVAINIFNYKLPYRDIFGGVCAISTNHFRQLNGFSNSFWGWGGEDDDMSNRIKHHKLFVSRYPPTIARYTMLSHHKEKPSPNRYDTLKLGAQKFDKDGLNSLKYSVVKSKANLLYTWILVSIDVPR